MSHKILIATGIFALVVVGFALFGLSTQTAQGPANVAISTSTTDTIGSLTQATSTPSTPASGYTLAQVKTHNSASSCWAAISGSVYDLTAWINQHPGGPDKILGICGTDATAIFNMQHGRDSQPHTQLATFKIGALAQ